MGKTKDRERNGTVREIETEDIGLYGMSDATVRLVIDRHASQSLKEDYSVEELENRGRYYVVALVRPGGGVIDRLLVDKQSGSVSSLAGTLTFEHL